MATQRLRLVAPSGDRLTVDLPAAAPVSHVVAGVRFVGGSYGTGFQIGPRGYHEFACTHVAPAGTRERLVVHGREVVVAEAHDGQSSVATLIGAYHELMTVYAGPAPRRDRVLALFGSLRIEDHVDGMTVVPRAATLLDPANEHFVIVVKDHGSLSVPAPRQAAAMIPRHAGARTQHGEVWKAGYTKDSARSFLLGCPAGLAEVHLADTAAKTERDRLDWLDRIDIAWARG
ncbi:hypothetical protein Q5425_05125 [Amycolatopsis sp. A133]|uniref:hypothetical protein n=1 Tax=Amycolatopsis sp. A133 TaxID=3064472 RepID=UPI0027F100DB|nr:hypothetical protein [Amycolatopsis sp. A133]MDQ7803099.1 hypothetical protein [Amycolatopsis sp. A133]